MVTDLTRQEGPVINFPEQTVSTADADFHGRRRTRRLASGILTSLVSRGAASVAPLLLIPITLHYLGSELYGLWMAVGALASMALWADLGLGNGLLTKLTPCQSSGDWTLARKYVSTAYATLVPVACILTASLWSLSSLIPWSDIFNVTDPKLYGTARTVALICLSALFVNIPLSLVQRVQYAYQQVSQNNIWQSVGSVLTVALTWAAVAAKLEPVAVIGAAVSGPIVSNTANSIWVYSRSGRPLRPRLNSIDRSVIVDLFQLGGQFFALSIITLVALNSDNLIIAHSLGLAAVTEYSVPAKLFMALGLMVTLVNLPLWPANGDALARGDDSWVRKTTARMTFLSGTAVLLPAVALFFIGHRLLSNWLKADLHGSPWLFLGLGLWWVLLATAAPRFMVQNASGLILPQLIGWALYLVLSVPLKLLGANEFGVAGVAGASALGYALLVWPAAAIGYRRALSHKTQLNKQEAVP
jgi:O-antigen/teichoic acid export membrane protein